MQTYGALFCRARGLSEIALALVYFDVASQSEVELRQVFGAEELELTLRCEHPRPLAAPGVRGETTLRYKVNGSAEMTEYALVRASQR